MSDQQQRGVLVQGAGAASLAKVLAPMPAWRYLWVHADSGNLAAVNIWFGAPPANRAPDAFVNPGQTRVVDVGALGETPFWLQTVDQSAWSGQWVADIEPIGEDANVVGAIGQARQAQVIGTYTTTIAGKSDGPYVIPPSTVRVRLIYDNNGLGLTLEGRGAQTGAIYPVSPVPDSDVGLSQSSIAELDIEYGGPDSAVNIFHIDPVAGRTAYVVAVTTPLAPTVGAILRRGDTGTVTAANPVPITAGAAIPVTPPNPMPVSQSGAWNVGQSGAWTVGATQSGGWTVGATQSGPWSTAAADWSGVTPASFGPVTGSPTTIINAPGAGKTLLVCGWSLTIDPGSGVAAASATVQLKSHVTGYEIGRRHYNYGSQVGNMAGPGWDVTLHAPFAGFPANEALDVVITNAGGTIEVTGTVFYHT